MPLMDPLEAEFKYYRKRQGVDINRRYAEIPIEEAPRS